MKPKATKLVTTDIILETRRPRKDKNYAFSDMGCPIEDIRYPVMIRVTYNRTYRTYIIRYVPEKIGNDFTNIQKYWLGKFDKGISLTKQEFSDVFDIITDEEKGKFEKHTDKKTSKREPFKTLAIYLGKQESEARDTTAGITPFAFELFKERFFSKSKDNHDVFEAIDSKARVLRREGKLGTAVFYENTLNALKDFTKKHRYPFTKITVSFLNEFEKGLMERKVGKKNPRNISRTTISMYMRCLRSVFNESAPEEIDYPFGKAKYMIPKWSHNKRALTQADVAKIAGYPVVDGTMLHKSRDLWLFSYLCNGINFKDIANLKYSNIKGDTIVFERAKTAKSGDDVINITVIITRMIGKIIDRWGNKPASQNQYIFPILNKGLTADDQHRTIKQRVKNTNKYMRRICADLKIPEATTYVARHSFATVLKRSGASVEFISESLGHRNISTTQNYLADFEIDEKKKWAELLLPNSESL
jgi:integrase/recombinase XerD